MRTDLHGSWPIHRDKAHHDNVKLIHAQASSRHTVAVGSCCANKKTWRWCHSWSRASETMPTPKSRKQWKESGLQNEEKRSREMLIE